MDRVDRRDDRAASGQTGGPSQYEAPTLTLLGSVAEVTLSGFQTGGDGINAGGAVNS